MRSIWPVMRIRSPPMSITNASFDELASRMSSPGRAGPKRNSKCVGVIAAPRFAQSPPYFDVMVEMAVGPFGDLPPVELQQRGIDAAVRRRRCDPLVDDAVQGTGETRRPLPPRCRRDRLRTLSHWRWNVASTSCNRLPRRMKSVSSTRSPSGSSPKTFSKKNRYGHAAYVSHWLGLHKCCGPKRFARPRGHRRRSQQPFSFSEFAARSVREQCEFPRRLNRYRRGRCHTPSDRPMRRTSRSRPNAVLTAPVRQSARLHGCSLVMGESCGDEQRIPFFPPLRKIRSISWT